LLVAAGWAKMPLPAAERENPPPHVAAVGMEMRPWTAKAHV